MYTSKKFVLTSFKALCAMLLSSHTIEAAIPQTKSSCSVALANSTMVKFDNREVRLRDATSLLTHCQDLLFTESFPNSQCVLRSFPYLQDGKLPVHSELYRQFAGISLQRMLTSNERPFAELDPLKDLLAPAQTYREIAGALDKLQIICTDEFCFGYLTLASTLISKFRGYKFSEELRLIITRTSGKMILYPGQLSTIALIPGADSRFWANR